MEQLCRKIHMPGEVTQAVLRWHRDPAFGPDLRKLTREDTWQEGLRELREALGADPGGFKELCCMLRCALDARKEFDRLGISEAVYYDTMGCFSRFVREHMESYGCWGFDRGFWTVRQISCRLLRIGQLEYELTTLNGAPAISLHIPTDVQLRIGPLRESYLSARELIGRVFPEYDGAVMYCHSWLLSPTLHSLLPPDSNILTFQRSFRITPLSAPAEGYILWVFKNPRLLPEQYPENTSLQRRLKAHILHGGSFVDARGILVEAPFSN